MSRDAREWMEGGRYLPVPLRDFHRQKDVFKSLHQWIGKPVKPMYHEVLLAELTRAGVPAALVEKVREGLGISWVDGQCYVIDYFLRFMAACGWTLQRSRVDIEFASLSDIIAKRRAAEVEQLRTMFAAAHPTPETDHA